MQLKDWFYNGYSRNDLEQIFQDFHQINDTPAPDTSGWGRCTLARELEMLAPQVFGNFSKKFI